MNRQLILHSTSEGPFQRKIEALIKKVAIASTFDEKVVMSFNKSGPKALIGQREIAWIRLYNDNDQYEDYLTEDVIFMDTKKGALIQALGSVQKVDEDFIAEKVLEFIKSGDKKELSSDKAIYEYRKKISKEIKMDMKFLFSKKIDLNVNQFDLRERKDKMKWNYMLNLIMKKLSKDSTALIKERLVIRRNNG